MDTMQKLIEAMQYLKSANRLLQEAAEENGSLDIGNRDPIKIAIKELKTFVEYNKDNPLMGFVSLNEINEPEKVPGTNKHSDNTTSKTFDLDREFYFYPALRNWIFEVLSSDKTSTNEALVKKFTDKGIKRVLASHIIEAERKDCLTSKDYKIDFDYYEPEDDRIFTGSQVFDFAYEIGLEAMSAGFLGNKSINSLSLDKFISEKLDQEGGDGSHERWIPRSEWPNVDEVNTISMKKEKIKPVKKKNRNRKQKP